MEPLVEDKPDTSLNTKGLGAWAGTLVGALVGVLAGVVGLAIEIIYLNFFPSYGYNPIPAVWGPIGAFCGVVAGTIAGTIGL